MCLLLSHYVIQEVVNVQRHCNAKAAFVLILSVLCIFELSNKKPLVISSFSFRFFRRLVKKHVLRRLSHTFFVTQESIFFIKVGKVTFSARKSLLCRNSALSLHSETDGRLPLPGLVPPKCLRHAFVVPSLPEAKTGRREGERKIA